MSGRPGSGMVAVVARGAQLPTDVRARLDAVGDQPAVQVNGVWVSAWGLGRVAPTRGAPLLLTSTNLSETGEVAPDVLARWLADGDLVQLARMLPPFGALGLTADGLRLVTDLLAFRPVFRCEGEGWSGVSTSALLLSQLLDRGLDDQGVLLQSQLGWQLGGLTLFDGVTALDPGESLTLGADGIRCHSVPEPDPVPGSLSPAEGVAAAATALRDLMAHYLDGDRDPTLQLTGGQDSRIVLSAIPPARRRGLKVMTLDTGSQDAVIAAELARRYGMEHTVRTMSGMTDISPSEWFQRVLATARLHDCMADPIARAVTGWAEESFEQGHRLSGLGGELARGFFYHGRVRPLPVTRSRSETLARWRMLVNDAVEPEALAGEQRQRAVETSVDLIHEALLRSGQEWFSATDELYLHRTRRWAGLGESAVSFRRAIINPMLDHRFVSVARRLSPRAKHRSKFLGQLQVALDGELASLPLDDRPAPRVYASPGLTGHVLTSAARLGKIARKAAQRALGSHRPPPGGNVVAARLAGHLRNEPAALDPVRASGVFDEQWLDGVARGELRPRAGSLALLMNVLASTRPEAG